MKKRRKQHQPEPASPNGSERPRLATLSDDDRREYIRRQGIFDGAAGQFQAAGAYLDQYQAHLVHKYGLPTTFDIDLATGAIHPRVELVDEENQPVAIGG